jgi:peroxiredoxin
MKSPFKLIAALAGVAIAATAAGLVAIPLRPAAAPEARFATLAGETFSTSQLRGKVLIVSFWATDCPMCLAEMPKLVDLHRKYAARDFDTVAVAVKHDSPTRVADYTRRRGLPFNVALDRSGDIARIFGNIRITPTTIVLDKQGRVLKSYVGEPNWKELDRVVERALAVRA